MKSPFKIQAPFKVVSIPSLVGEPYRSLLVLRQGIVHTSLERMKISRWRFGMHLPAASEDLIWACFTCGLEFVGREQFCPVCKEPRCDACIHEHEKQ